VRHEVAKDPTIGAYEHAPARATELLILRGPPRRRRRPHRAEHVVALVLKEMALEVGDASGRRRKTAAEARIFHTSPQRRQEGVGL